MTPNTPSHNEERIAELAEMLFRDADLLSLDDFIDALKNFRHSIESEVREKILASLEEIKMTKKHKLIHQEGTEHINSYNLGWNDCRKESIRLLDEVKKVVYPTVPSKT